MLTLEEGEGAEIAAYVMIPADAVEGVSDVATIAVESIFNQQSKDESYLITTAEFRRIFLPMVKYD